MVHYPLAYAELLKKKIQKHGADVWQVTRLDRWAFWRGASASAFTTPGAQLNAALSGSLVSVTRVVR